VHRDLSENSPRHSVTVQCRWDAPDGLRPGRLGRQGRDVARLKRRCGRRDLPLISGKQIRFQKGELMKTKGKVLVLVSSGHGLPLQDGKVYSGAGYYLNELTVPVRALMKDGYEITCPPNGTGLLTRRRLCSLSTFTVGHDSYRLLIWC
jgi:hypothetical protein